MLAALPAGEVDRMDRAVADRRLGDADQHRHQHAALQPLMRLVAHPARLARGRRPDHHHGLGLRQLGRDQLGEILARQDLAIPPHAPPAGLERMGEPRGERPVLAGVADEHVGHGACLTSARLCGLSQRAASVCARTDSRPRGGTSPCRSPRSTQPPPIARAKEALAGGEAGIGQLGAAAERLREIAPEIGPILGSSEVSAHLGTYARCDEEAVRQQSRLFREATAANLCLLGRRRAEQPACSPVPASSATARRDVDSAPAAGNRPRRPGARRAGGALRLSGARGRPAAPLAQHARPRRGRAPRHLPRDRARAPPRRARPPRPPGLALFCRHLFDEQRDWLVGRAQRHRVSSDVTNRWGGLATALTFLGGSAATDRRVRSPTHELAGPRRRGRHRVHGLRPQPRGACAATGPTPTATRRRRWRWTSSSTRLDEVAAEIAAGRPEALTAFVDAGHGRAGDRAQAVARRHQAGRGGAGEPGCAAQGAARGTAQAPGRRWSCAADRDNAG